MIAFSLHKIVGSNITAEFVRKSCYSLHVYIQERNMLQLQHIDC